MPGADNNTTKARQHIMVIDDEADILRIIRMGLTRYGHSVVTFSSPMVALEEFSRNHQDYALVITDVRMPGLSGLEFAKKVKVIDPEIKMLVMTAFELSQYELSYNLPFIKIEDVLKKPVTLSKMCQAIDRYVTH